MEVLRGLAVLALGFDADFLVLEDVSLDSLDSLDSFVAFFAAGFLEEEEERKHKQKCVNHYDRDRRTDASAGDNIAITYPSAE